MQQFTTKITKPLICWLQYKLKSAFFFPSFTQVYDLKEGPTWCRCDVYIEDEPTAKKICVKLWDSHANKIDDSHQSQKVTIENVEVDIYQDRRQLKSTDLTNVIVSV